LKNTFISQHNLPVNGSTCPIISQASENQQQKILWAAVGASMYREIMLRNKSIFQISTLV
jgi:hypothetical protein